MRAILTIWLLLSAGGAFTQAQSARDLMDLDFLYVGAHPDDEGLFTATLARYNLDKGYRGSVATFTLGEGGGNAIGPELGASLGLIRFEEMRRSLARVGVDRFYFLGLEDFYFTQSAELTEEVWSSQNPEYYCELIRVIRLTRPEVLVTMWPGPGTHGHHQMAARSAIRAFDDAADGEVCPALITQEYLEPWQPLKLYLSAFGGPYSFELPMDGYSHAADMTYADLRALALRSYRSQGWDNWNAIPASNTFPERRLLVKSLVPVNEPERHLLEGTHIPSGASPVGVRMKVRTESYQVLPGDDIEVSVSLFNGTEEALESVRLYTERPEGWEIATSQIEADTLGAGESIDGRFRLRPGEAVNQKEPRQIWVSYAAENRNGGVAGRNYVWAEVTSPVKVSFRPLLDIANYREFAREQNIEWLIPDLVTRVPLFVGEPTEAVVEISNDSDEGVSGVVSFDVPDGISVDGPRDFQAEPGSAVQVPVTFNVEADALPPGRHSGTERILVSVAFGGTEISDQADLYLLPFLEIPRAGDPIVVDGDLSDMLEYGMGRIGHLDTWSGEVTGPEDSSADFYLAYDDENLYVGVRVYDDEVVCHMPPDRIRNHWYGDAIEITIDPFAVSPDVSTTLKAGIFPCTTEGPEPSAARYADASPGPIERSAPGMEVASQLFDDGYTIQTSIPWNVMPEPAGSGDTIGLNILVYDADDPDAEPGADIGKSRIGWASVISAQQAATYLWPRVRLE